MSELKINPNAVNEISNLFNQKAFINAHIDIQKAAINSITLTKQTEGGFMGKFLGTKMPNMSIYSAFLLCIILLIFIIIDMFFLACKGESCLNMDLMKMIIPVFTMSLGYMFGKNDTRDS